MLLLFETNYTNHKCVICMCMRMRENISFQQMKIPLLLTDVSFTPAIRLGFSLQFNFSTILSFEIP